MLIIIWKHINKCYVFPKCGMMIGNLHTALRKQLSWSGIYIIASLLIQVKHKSQHDGHIYIHLMSLRLIAKAENFIVKPIEM